MKAIYAFFILLIAGSVGCSQALPPPAPPAHAPAAMEHIPRLSVSDFTGTYAIDLERSDKSTGHINIRSNVRLTVNPDKSIDIGAGKIKRFELVSDFNDKGLAQFIERTEVDGTVYEKQCDMKFHSDGYVEVSGDYFKVNKSPIGSP